MEKAQKNTVTPISSIVPSVPISTCNLTLKDEVGQEFTFYDNGEIFPKDAFNELSDSTKLKLYAKAWNVFHD